MKCKGTPENSVIRTPTTSQDASSTATTAASHGKKQAKEEPPKDLAFLNALTSAKTTQQKKKLVEELTEAAETTTTTTLSLTALPPGVQKPHYQLIHRGQIDMTDFTGDRMQLNSNRPKELVIKVELPGVVSRTRMMVLVLVGREVMLILSLFWSVLL